MRRLFLLTMPLTLLIFCQLAAAQGYSARVTHNSNLRASHSLDARIVDSAPAGTTVTVLGSHEDWLRIDWQGRVVWMAGWLAMTRIADAPAAPAADVDNCCFLDRQCSSDHDWEAGYWAYQNMECGAPAQTGGASTPAPVSETPADVDNCCFLDWFCQSDEDWNRGYFAYQEGQCAHGAPSSNAGIRIEGSPGFTFQVELGLDLLRSRAPKWYGYVVSGLDVVEQTKPPVIGVDVSARVFSLSNGDEFPPPHDQERFAGYMASVLIHEACHVHRHQAGLESGGLIGETACVETEIAALLEFAPNHPDIESSRRVLANIHRPECQWWHGEYKTCYD